MFIFNLSVLLYPLLCKKNEMAEILCCKIDPGGFYEIVKSILPLTLNIGGHDNSAWVKTQNLNHESVAYHPGGQLYKCDK